MMYVGYGTVNNDNNTSTMCLQYGTGWKILLFAAFVHQYRKPTAVRENHKHADPSYSTCERCLIVSTHAHIW